MSAEFEANFWNDVPRGNPTRPLQDQRPPNSAWMPTEAILKSARLTYEPRVPGAKILIGALADQLLGIEDDRHILTVGGNRSGKSVTVIGNLLHYRGSVLAIDPKGELAKITAARRRDLGLKVHILDPFQTVTSPEIAALRTSFNPMAGLHLGSSSLVEDADMIADALIAGEDARDPHWNESARALLGGLILHTATAQAMEGVRDLVAVKFLVDQILLRRDSEDDTSGAGRSMAAYLVGAEILENVALLRQTGEHAEVADAIEAAAQGFYEKPAGERGSVLSNVRRHLHFLSYGAIRDVLTGTGFDLADLKREAGTTVYLCLPASRLSTCNRWLRIFVNQLLDAMERTPATSGPPVLAVLDEFPILGHMRQIENAVGQVASFGVKLWTIIQDWSQGEALYGKRWESFAANAGVLQFFGVNDLTTARYLSERLGRCRVATQHQSDITAAQRLGGASGISHGVENHPLLSPDEIMIQFARSDPLKRQCVIWAGFRPMMIQRVEYFDPSGPLARHHRPPITRPQLAASAAPVLQRRR